MGKIVEIPEVLHDVLTARAAIAGLSLSEYLARELDVDAGHGRAKAEVLERIRSRPPVDLGITTADLVREGREERDRKLTDRWSSSMPRR
jgi:hypothetical protein